MVVAKSQLSMGKSSLLSPQNQQQIQFSYDHKTAQHVAQPCTGFPQPLCVAAINRSVPVRN